MTALEKFWNRIEILFKTKEVTYGKEFFSDAWFTNWNKLQYVLLELIMSTPSWRSILDFGCGPGVMIDLMNKRGLDYTGYDPSLEARELYLMYYGMYPNKYISKLDHYVFDVVMSFDVLEHMADEEIAVFISKFSNVRDIFVNISRTPSIPGHINIKTDDRWISFFASMGRTFNEELTSYLRNKYKIIKPDCDDAWDKNIFVFSL